MDLKILRPHLDSFFYIGDFTDRNQGFSSPPQTHHLRYIIYFYIFVAFKVSEMVSKANNPAAKLFFSFTLVGFSGFAPWADWEWGEVQLFFFSCPGWNLGEGKLIFNPSEIHLFSAIYRVYLHLLGIASLKLTFSHLKMVGNQ